MGRVRAAAGFGETFRLRVEPRPEPRPEDVAGRDSNAARDVELGLGLGEESVTSSVEVVARTIVIATGVRDQFPVFPGRDRCVGVSLFWCIVCDGFEAIDKRVAVVGGRRGGRRDGPRHARVHRSSQRSRQAGPASTVPESRLADLAANGIAALRFGRGLEYPNDNGQIEALVLDDPPQTRIPVDMVFTFHTPKARNDLARQLGVELNALGQIIVDRGAAHQRRRRVCSRRRRPASTTIRSALQSTKGNQAAPAPRTTISIARCSERPTSRNADRPEPAAAASLRRTGSGRVVLRPRQPGETTRQHEDRRAGRDRAERLLKRPLETGKGPSAGAGGSSRAAGRATRLASVRS
jgi:hypothetical protein